MNIIKNTDGPAIVFRLEGRLDTASSPQLETDLAAFLASADEPRIEIDMAKLVFISSAGLRILLSAQKKINIKKGEMTIRNASESIKEIFDVTGFSGILHIE